MTQLRVTIPVIPSLQELVETSMLAAISGLLFVITVTLGIDGSFLFSYMLPFPILMAALRRSSSAGWSVMWVSASLLLSTLHHHPHTCTTTHLYIVAITTGIRPVSVTLSYNTNTCPTPDSPDILLPRIERGHMGHATLPGALQNISALI